MGYIKDGSIARFKQTSDLVYSRISAAGRLVRIINEVKYDQFVERFGICYDGIFDNRHALVPEEDLETFPEEEQEAAQLMFDLQEEAYEGG